MTIVLVFICGVMKNAGWAPKQKKNVVFKAKSPVYRGIISKSCFRFQYNSYLLTFYKPGRPNLKQHRKYIYFLLYKVEYNISLKTGLRLSPCSSMDKCGSSISATGIVFRQYIHIMVKKKMLLVEKKHGRYIFQVYALQCADLQRWYLSSLYLASSYFPS